MKTVLILSRQPETFFELAKRLSNSETSVDVATYNDLGFLIDGNEASIVNYLTGDDLRVYSKILVLSTSLYHAQNYIFSALACYCRKYNIEMLDDSFTNCDGKLYAMWRFWEKGVRVPKTAFGPADFLAEVLERFGSPAVLKSVNGTKGRDNYLVRSGEEIKEIVERDPDTRYILQNYIPNDGDYRIVVTNFEAKLAIYRSANGKDFRNNTSLGGEASLVPLDELDSEVIKLATEAAKALNIKIAGADILQNRETGEYSVLEVNRTPQLASGAFTETKLEVIRELL